MKADLDLGKRKASFVEGIGSLRERKRARDDSEPAEEDEPGTTLLTHCPSYPWLTLTLH
jgi:hypothetical protein